MAVQKQTTDDKYKSGYNACAKEVMTFLRQDNNINNEDRARMARHISTSLPTLFARDDTAVINNATTNVIDRNEAAKCVMPTLTQFCDMDKAGRAMDDAPSTVVCGSQIIQVPPGSFSTGQYAVLIATPATIGGLPTFVTAPVAAMGIDQNNNNVPQPNPCTTNDNCVQVTKLEKDNNGTTVDQAVYSKETVDVDHPSQPNIFPLDAINNFNVWRPWAFGQ